MKPKGVISQIKDLHGTVRVSAGEFIFLQTKSLAHHITMGKQNNYMQNK